MSQHPPIPLLGQFSESEKTLWLAALASALPNEQIVPLAQLTTAQRNAATIAIAANPTAEELGQLPNLIWLQSLWAGVEKMASIFKGSRVKVVRLVDPALARSMSEAVLAWVLYLHRNMPDYRTLQSKRQWQALPYVPAQSKTIGILGLGELGAACARRLVDNDFNVQGWSSSEKNIASVTSLTGDSGLMELAASSDILINLLPLTPKTRFLLNGDFFAHARPGTQLINFGRGEVIADSALLNALDKGIISHAVLDVFATEPLPSEHAFWQHAKVTVLPHISAPTQPETASLVVKKNIERYRELKVIPAFVDFERGY